jgi:hypothetical protein
MENEAVTKCVQRVANCTFARAPIYIHQQFPPCLRAHFRSSGEMGFDFAIKIRRERERRRPARFPLGAPNRERLAGKMDRFLTRAESTLGIFATLQITRLLRHTVGFAGDRLTQ